MCIRCGMKALWAVCTILVMGQGRNFLKVAYIGSHAVHQSRLEEKRAKGDADGKR